MSHDQNDTRYQVLIHLVPPSESGSKGFIQLGKNIRAVFKKTNQRTALFIITLSYLIAKRRPGFSNIYSKNFFEKIKKELLRSGAKESTLGKTNLELVCLYGFEPFRKEPRPNGERCYELHIHPHGRRRFERPTEHDNESFWEKNYPYEMNALRTIFDKESGLLSGKCQFPVKLRNKHLITKAVTLALKSIPHTRTVREPKQLRLPAGANMLRALVTTETAQQEFVGHYGSLRYSYEPIPFSQTDIEECFIRKHVMNEVEAFLHSDKKTLVIKGPPGTGKSTLLAQIVRSKGLPHYFATQATHPAAAMRSLLAQIILAWHLPHLIKDLACADNSTLHVLFRNALNEATAKTPGDIVLAIDNIGSSQLLPRFRELPDSIRFIITTQPGTDVSGIRPTTTIDLSPTASDTIHDINDFLQREASKRPLSNIIRRAGLTQDTFCHQLRLRSGHLWIYIALALKEITASGQLDLSKMPRGLHNYYLEYWQKRFGGHSSCADAQIRVLSTLAATSSPLSLRQLADFSDTSPAEVLRTVSDWNPMLRMQKTTHAAKYTLFHDSLRQFLAGKTVGGKRMSDLHKTLYSSWRSANARIARTLINERPRNTAVVAYRDKHLTAHIIAADSWQFILRLLIKNGPALTNALADIENWLSTRTTLQADDGNSHGAFIDEVGHWLARQYIIGAVAELEPEIILAYAKSGTWTPEQALRAATLLHSPADKLHALSLLSTVLQDSSQIAAANHIKELLARCSIDIFMLDALLFFAQQTESDVARTIILEQILRSKDMRVRMRGLACILPHLNPTQRKQVLGEIEQAADGLNGCDGDLAVATIHLTKCSCADVARICFERIQSGDIKAATRRALDDTDLDILCASLNIAFPHDGDHRAFSALTFAHGACATQMLKSIARADGVSCGAARPQLVVRLCQCGLFKEAARLTQCLLPEGRHGITMILNAWHKRPARTQYTSKPGEGYRALLLEVADSIQHELSSSIAPSKSTLPISIKQIESLQWPHQRCAAIASIAEHATDTDLNQLITLLKRELLLRRVSGGIVPVTTALCSVAKRATKTPPNQQIEVWHELSRSFLNHPPEHAFRFQAALAPIIVSVAGQAASRNFVQELRGEL